MTSRTEYQKALNLSVRTNVPLNARYRARGTNVAYWINEQKRIRKRSNLVSALKRKFKEDKLAKSRKASEERKRLKTVTIELKISVFDLKFHGSHIETVDEIVNPIIESIKGQERLAINNYIRQQATYTYNLRIVLEGEEAPMDYTRLGIFHNLRYKSLPDDAQIIITEQGTGAVRQFDELILRMLQTQSYIV